MHFDNSASTSALEPIVTLAAVFEAPFRFSLLFGHELFHRYAPIGSRVNRVREIEFIQGIL